MKKFLFIFSLIFAITSCCRTASDPCDGKKCNASATCVDGTCVCQNSYNVKGECVPKDVNTFYYAGKSCYCTPDTFTLKITPLGNGAAEFNMRFQPPLGGSLGGAGATGTYISNPTGDSIKVFGILEGTFSNCEVKGKKCNTELIGKFNGKNQIDAVIRFFELKDYETTIDECKIILKQ